MLQTDWLKVGTAGKTIDGREIKAEWLEKMADVYSPHTYTAGVNSEHFFYPGLGYVTALKSAQDELGRMALYARLAPTSELLARYQNKRQLFFSMEMRADFPAKGDFYLTGLAITDVPASQGLEPARYAAGDEARERFFDTASLQDEDVPDIPGSGEAPPHWWSALWQALRLHAEPGGRSQKHSAEQEHNEEHDGMTNEEREAFKALQQQVETVQAQVAEIHGNFTAQEETAKAEPTDVSAAMSERFAGEVEAKIAEAVAPLTERLEKLEAYLAEPADIERGEVTGPAGGGEQFVF